MRNAVFFAVGHADDKRLKWCGVEQFTDACFHSRSGNIAAGIPQAALTSARRVARRISAGIRRLGAMNARELVCAGSADILPAVPGVPPGTSNGDGRAISEISPDGFSG